MAEAITTKRILSLDCQIQDGSLRISHAGAPLDEPFVVPTGVTIIELNDFTHEGNLCRVHAFSIGEEGILNSWVRWGNSVRWPVGGPEETYDLDVVVLQVAHTPEGATSSRVLAAFQPDSWHTLVRVRVPTDDTRPGG